MNKQTRKFVEKTFPEQADRIIRYSLTEKRIQDAGIQLRKNEIFVQYPGWPDYYGSNYGRCISIKDGILTLKAETIDSRGYVIYTFTRPALFRNGTKVNRQQLFTISGHRLVADLFFPDFWPELTRKQKETHHLNHVRNSNCWKDLVLVPGKLHFWLNRVDKIWYSPGNGKPFKRIHPYDLQRRTGLTLEEIILPLKNREPDVVTHQDGDTINVYNVNGHMIGYTMVPAAEGRDDK